jgi:hypothetical protein
MTVPPPSQVNTPGQIGENYRLGPLELPDTPAGGQTDSIYQAALAALKFNTQNQYGQIRRQIGWTDDSGQYIPGLVETEAFRQAEAARHGIGLADEATTQEMQRAGTLFSGYRGTAQARNEFPYVQALADLDVKVPQQLSELYQQAGNLSQQYVIGQNQLLAEAAQRYLQQLLAQQGGGGGGGEPPPDGGGGGGGYVPPDQPDPNLPPELGDPYLENPSRPDTAPVRGEGYLYY